MIKLENTGKNKNDIKTVHSLTIRRSPLLIYKMLFLEKHHHTEHRVLFPMQWNIYISISPVVRNSSSA